MMKKIDLLQIALLRIVTGMLGERQKDPWWVSSFFSGAGASFLNPVFCRTIILARYQGVCEAAALVHNKHIGIGAQVFHLFLLPESLEREIHRLVGEEQLTADQTQKIASPEKALAYLNDLTGGISIGGAGPIRIGTETELWEAAAWKKVSAYYLQGFQEGTKVFPFFSER
jgi:hypothetical protein